MSSLLSLKCSSAADSLSLEHSQHADSVDQHAPTARHEGDIYHRPSHPKASQQLLQSDDWDCPADPDNPHNWPAWKRFYHTSVPAAAALVCTIASSVYTPAIDDVASSFGVSTEVALLPFSLYVLGLGFGPLIAAPCSERFGRRMVYITTLPIFALLIMGSGFSQTIEGLILTRFFAGVFGGPSLVIGSATIADLFKPRDRALPMSLYISTPFCGPAIAPLIGGYATENLGWRWTVWSNLIIAAAIILVTLPMQETHKSVILQRRAKRRGYEPPVVITKESVSNLQRIRQFAASVLIRPLHMASTEPIVAFAALYIALNFAMLYSFFVAFPTVLQDAYGFSLGQVGITFLAIGVGALLGCLIIIVVDQTVFKVDSKSAEKGKPERRLYLSMGGSILLPASLFWFGWTARSNIHWICPIFAEVVFSCGNMLVFMSFVLYLSDTYGAKYTASAMTANTFLRYLLGSTFPLWVNYMYTGLGTGWASSVLAFVSLLMSPVPWIFFHLGPRMREQSGYR